MLKNSFIALQGTIIAQGIGFLFLPVLTRLYTPAAFGTYQLYMSVLMLLLVVASLRYEIALLTAEKDGEERAVLRLCLSLNLLAAILTLVVSTIILASHPDWLKVPEPVLWLLSVSVFAGGIIQTLVYVLYYLDY